MLCWVHYPTIIKYTDILLNRMQPLAQSTYSHQDDGTTSFHDIHENEVCGYGSYSGDDCDSDNYIGNSEASAEDLLLEDCNLEYIFKEKAKFMMLPFEPRAHMRTLDLEAIFTPEFMGHPFLYTHTLREMMTDGELHIGMQF